MVQRMGGHVTEKRNTGGQQATKIDLRRRERVPAVTTQGRYFARHLVVRDLPIFDEYIQKGDAATVADHEKLGKLALLTLVAGGDDDEITPALTEATFTALTPDDITTLANAVAIACRLTLSSTTNSIDALGAALLKSLSEIARQVADTADAIRRTFTHNFGALSTSLQANLQDKFLAVSAARAALGSSSAVGAAVKGLGRQSAILGSTSSLAMPSIGGTLKAAKRNVDLDALRPPRFEETAAGRTAARAASASEESARQLTEVAGLMGTMADGMASLQTVFLSEVLPKWFRDLEEGGDATRTTLRQAESSLEWAKWALVASVVVSLMMTGWQIWLAREYKLENDAQQDRSELLMQQQLTALQELNKELNRRRREEVAPQPVSTNNERRSVMKSHEPQGKESDITGWPPIAAPFDLRNYVP